MVANHMVWVFSVGRSKFSFVKLQFYHERNFDLTIQVDSSMIKILCMQTADLVQAESCQKILCI